MRMNHLNLSVADVDRSRAFYERWFGFDAGPSEWLGDALFIRDETGFDLALTPVGHVPRLGEDAFHIGFACSDRNDVQGLLDALRADGVPIVAVDDEPDFQAFKCRDPDGYLLEVSWTAPPTDA